MAAREDAIGVGLLGLGVVGGGVAHVLLRKGEDLARRIGRPLALRGVRVRDMARHRDAPVPLALLTTNPDDVLGDPRVHVVVELMGGEQPATTYIQRALEAGKHVVTANKEALAKQGPALFQTAARCRRALLFEAAVGGGIPVIGPLRRDLLANEVQSIRAIINGTTNYILTRMARDGREFAQALREAQSLGYAEADPTSDIEGHDAAYKLAILASLAFHTHVPVQHVYREGISALKPRDFRYAAELGYAIKLLAIARRDDSGVQARVHPAFVPLDTLLAKVDGPFNAIEVEGDLVGRVVFHGQGAGASPTSSAVVGDIIELARHLTADMDPLPAVRLDRGLPVRPMDDLETQYYFRLVAPDRAGVLAKIARVLGDLNISIASVIQKDADYTAGTAELVFTTHRAREAHMQEALRQMERLDVVRCIEAFLRVEEGV